MFLKIGFNFELFGSGINTVSDNYCSLFEDIEYLFGSHGSFFNIKNIKTNLYWCNPPYDDTIMYNSAKKIKEFLEINNDIIFLVTIPIWDIKTQNIIDNIDNVVIDYNKDIDENEFDDYKTYKELKPYIKKELIIPKNRIPYFNYKRNIHIYAVNTYLLLVHHPNINKNLLPVIENINNNFNIIQNNDKEDLYINRDIKIKKLKNNKKLVNHL